MLTTLLSILPSCGPILASFCFFAILILPGCTERVSDPAPVRIDTVGGIVHVFNPPVGQWLPEEHWRIVELMRLGGQWEPAEEMFSGDLLTATFGPDGGILILDSEAAVLSMYSSDGDFLRQIGGPGRGPSEFISPSGIVYDGFNRIWVANGFSGQYTLFTQTGEFIRTERRPVSTMPRLQHPLYYFPEGGILDEASGFPQVLLVQTDTNGIHVDTVAAIRTPDISDELLARPVRPGSDFQKIVRNYVPRQEWVVTPASLIWTATSGKLELVQRSFSGDTLRVVHTQHRDVKLTSLEERMIDNGLHEVNLSPSQVNLRRPIIQGLHILPDGHLLVHIETEVGEDSSVFDVFSSIGEYMGTLDFGFAPASRAVMSFRGDTLLAPTLGPLDVPYVVKAAIQRGQRRAR